MAGVPPVRNRCVPGRGSLTGQEVGPAPSSHERKPSIRTGQVSVPRGRIRLPTNLVPRTVHRRCLDCSRVYLSGVRPAFPGAPGRSGCLPLDQPEHRDGPPLDE